MYNAVVDVVFLLAWRFPVSGSRAGDLAGFYGKGYMVGGDVVVLVAIAMVRESIAHRCRIQPTQCQKPLTNTSRTTPHTQHPQPHAKTPPHVISTSDAS